MRIIGRRTGLAVAMTVAIGLAASACTDVLVEPKSEVTSGNVFTDEGAYRSFLAKLYAGLAVSGQQGPAGEPDIEGIDEGFSQYIRGYWQLQTLPTDEAVIGWGDMGLPELVTGQWASANQFVGAMYYRIYFQVALANEFLRETAPDVLASRGHDNIAEMPQYRAEARLLRALSYWHALDLFRNVPLVTEDFQAGDPPPDQVTPETLFEFIETELTEIRGTLPAVGAAEYGRADQGMAAMLLAKLYMNAEVYGVGDRYADAMSEVQTVIGGPYTLDDDYQEIFLADNHTSPEIIFAVPFDGQNTQTWGGTTFIVHASVGGFDMNAAAYGIDGGWWGLRATPEFVAKFETGANGPDGRSGIFFTLNQDSLVTDLGNWWSGYAFPKYQNVTSTGATGSHLTFPDTDFPMFRLGDAYLMYAEAFLRGGGGTQAQALSYVNALRQRAYGDNSGDITGAELTLDFILDERARELAWEGHRRNDLVRFGQFSGGSYVWAFKGGTAAGGTLADYLNIYPIPSSELLANPNLEQNPQYGGGS